MSSLDELYNRVTSVLSLLALPLLIMYVVGAYMSTRTPADFAARGSKSSSSKSSSSSASPSTSSNGRVGRRRDDRSRSRSSTPRPWPSASPPPTGLGDKYPGMVNLSGTLCYMNSVLQSLASLYHLRLHLKLLVDLAVDLDIETPVSDAVFDTLYDLNQPSATQPAPLRPLDLLSALVELPQIRRMLGTREQQDAHELFVVLAGAISDEATKVAKENDLRKAGLSHASDLSTPSPRSSPAPSLTIRRRRPDRSAPTPLPWEGLLARRRTCAACGYADVVRLDTMGGMELSIPRNGETRLHDCIENYLAPERLDDVVCEMCTVRATLAKYEAMAQAGKAAAAIPLAEPSAPAPSKSSKKKKKKSTAASSAAIPLTTITPDLAQASTQRAIERLRNMVSSGVPALDMAGITFDKVCTTSLRATSIARAPRVLRFHFVRSEYTPYGQLLKKTARVHFPPTLQLDAYMERGVLEPPNARVPTVASLLGGKATAVAEAATSATIGAAAAAAAAAPARTRTLYRLHSAILHHGYTHSSGHFVALRRKPDAPPNIPGKGWLRISDADVEEVGIESLVDASAQVFMLFYEREDAGDVVYAAHADVEEYETSTPGEVDDVDGINYTAHNFIDTTTTSASPSAWPTYPPSQTLHTLGLPSDPFRPKNGSPRKSLFDLE